MKSSHSSHMKHAKMAHEHAEKAHGHMEKAKDMGEGKGMAKKGLHEGGKMMLGKK